MKAKRTNIGFLAHVDAGKTTLIEALLYSLGCTRKLGRVDHGSTFLDTDKREKERGITIYTKLAEARIGDRLYNFIDTPGHVDFSLEAERALALLDYAVLVVAKAEKIEAHTRTLFRLLEKYGVPTFIFVNKTDLAGMEYSSFVSLLKEKLGRNIVDFSRSGNMLLEELCSLSDTLLEKYLQGEQIDDLDISLAIGKREVFPLLSGSALKLEGIMELARTLDTYTLLKEYPEDFGMECSKILRDRNSTLALCKLTGGTLKVKSILSSGDKVDQIRFYSGASFRLEMEAVAGDVVFLSGLDNTASGDAYGIGCQRREKSLSPVLSYALQVGAEVDKARLFQRLKELERENPELDLEYIAEADEIRASVMGRVQTEILSSVIEERYGVKVSFSDGAVIYKETIEGRVEGVGHYEPLRHYAEVHLVIEKGDRGAGVTVDSRLSVNELSQNYQNLILRHVLEKKHRGVLTGSELTDVRITLVAGRAHEKHTEGGDFREATYRAIRQGLMKAQSILLEPYYSFEIEVPIGNLGRAMSDVEKMKGQVLESESLGDLGRLKGICPVSTMRDYQMELIRYTHGSGILLLSFHGYEECHDTKEVLSQKGYDPSKDRDNPSYSVFCSHGAGFAVPWNEVEAYMHLESSL